MFLQRAAAAAVPFSWAAQRRAGGDRRVLWRVAVDRPSARPRLSEVEVLLGRFRASTSTSLWTSSHPKHSRSPQRSSTITLRPRLHASSRRPPYLRCTSPPLCPAPASAACSSSDESCSPFLRPPDRLQESSLDILAPTQPSLLHALLPNPLRPDLRVSLSQPWPPRPRMSWACTTGSARR